MKTEEAIEEFKKEIKKLYGNRLLYSMALMREVALQKTLILFLKVK